MCIMCFIQVALTAKVLKYHGNPFITKWSKDLTGEYKCILVSQINQNHTVNFSKITINIKMKDPELEKP